MIVAKFGGTSVSSSKNIETICNIVKKEKNKKTILVVSALSGVTDLLLSLPDISPKERSEKISKIRNLHDTLAKSFFKNKVLENKILEYVDERLEEIENLLKNKNHDKVFLDKLASFGEIMSSFLIAQALNSKNIKAKQIVATDLIITNDSFGSAEFILNPTIKNTKMILLPLVKKGIIPVITGFIGSTVKGKTTTLGRGGSDYSASIIGFSLKAQEIQIWTDVDGVFTTDPRILKNVKLLSHLSFREASELAAFGAKVLHPRTIRPAIKAGIPVRVLNTFNLKNEGTLIAEKVKSTNAITAIAFKRKVTLVNIYSMEMLKSIGFLAKVFEIFTKSNISVDLVSVSEVSISVTLDNDERLKDCVKELSQFASVTSNSNLGMVSLVGEGIVTSSNIIHKIFDILDKEKILVRMVSLGATDINISLVIQNDQVEQAVKMLHDKLLMKVRI
ncbi:MAG: aspartate kinase [Patescibacteria group bacterium]|nr:aspartate kinase [Patescibacteria group bacterium]